MPAFGYTARKNLLSTWPDRSKFYETECRVEPPGYPVAPQNESHTGFKNFLFLHNDDTRINLITLHADISDQGRIAIRHHTMTFASFRMKRAGEMKEPLFDAKWMREVDVRMKAGFGIGTLRMSLKDLDQNRVKRVALFAGPCGREVQRAVDADLKERKEKNEVANRFRSPRRRLQLKTRPGPKGAPQNVELLRARIIGAVPSKFGDVEELPLTDNDNYEKWDTPPINCMAGFGKKTHEFDFQFRDPATSVKWDVNTGTFDKRMSLEKKHPSLNRAIRLLTTFVMKREYCYFDVDEGVTEAQKNLTGVFYTDPYFKKLVPGPGENAVLQYIDEDFQWLVVRKGKVFAKDHWSLTMKHETGGSSSGGGFRNIESAVDAGKN